MKKILSAGLCLSMFLLAGCQGQPQDTTLTITDQAGREVTFEEPCQTAASGYYITTTIMIGLQQQDKLTGIEMKPETRPIYAKAAEEILDLPQLGNKKMFNVEECAKADPDVVFLPVGLESYVEELEALDIPVVLLEPEMPSNTGNIGRTCVATITRIHLIEPLVFKINEKALNLA